MLISALWHSDSIIHTYLPLYTLFHCGSSQVIEYSLLCYTAGPCLTIIYKIVHICQSQISISSLPLAFSHLWMCLFVVELEGFFTYSATISLWKGNHIVSYIQRHSESLCHQLIGGLVGFRSGCFDKNSKVARDVLPAWSTLFPEVSCFPMCEQPLMIAS